MLFSHYCQGHDRPPGYENITNFQLSPTKRGQWRQHLQNVREPLWRGPGSRVVSFVFNTCRFSPCLAEETCNTCFNTPRLKAVPPSGASRCQLGIKETVIICIYLRSCLIWQLKSVCLGSTLPNLMMFGMTVGSGRTPRNYPARPQKCRHIQRRKSRPASSLELVVGLISGQVSTRGLPESGNL